LKKLEKVDAENYPGTAVKELASLAVLNTRMFSHRTTSWSTCTSDTAMLIPHMLKAFMERDRVFKRSSRSGQSSPDTQRI